MSVIDTLFWVMEADSSKLRQGVSQGEAAIKKFEGQVSISDKAIHGMKESFVDLAKELALGVGSIFAVGEVLKGVFETSNETAQMGRLAKAMHVSIEDFAALTDVADKFGGSAEATSASVEGLNKQVQLLALTGQGRAKKIFEALGVTPTENGHAKDTIKVMEELSDKFHKMGMQKALGIGERLGLDRATIMMMTEGSARLKELMQEEKALGEPTEKDVQAALEWKETLNDLKHVWHTFKIFLGTEILPILNEVFKVIISFTQFVRDHKELFISALMAIGAAFIWMSREAIGASLMSLLGPLAKATYGVRTFGISLLFSEAMALLIPLAIAAVIAAILLLIEDIWKWVNGGKSAIGHFLGTWKDFKQKMIGMINELKQFFSTMWDGMKESFFKIIDAIVEKWEKTKAFLSKAMHPSQWFDDTGAEAGADAVTDANASGISSRPNYVMRAGGINKNNNVQIDKIEVQTQATDADGISRAVGDSLHSHMNQALNQSDDGVW